MLLRHFKYLAWHIAGEDGFRGWKLLSDDQIRFVIRDLMTHPKQQELFTTIQSFTEEGEIEQCPIYADFDGESALEDTKSFVREIESVTGSPPQIYFSGRKGFHITIPYFIKDSNCHKVVQTLLNNLGSWFSLDQRVYTTRRLWRVANSYHLRGNRFKIQLTPQELFTFELDDIRKFAREPGKLFQQCSALSDEGQHALHLLSADALEETKKITHLKNPCVRDSSWLEALTPCLRHLIEHYPEIGECNASLVILARFFKSCSVPLEEALDIILKQDHYYNREKEEKDVVKVFKSIYNSSCISRVGCRYSPDKEVLRQYCDPLCHFNEEKIWFTNG